MRARGLEDEIRARTGLLIDAYFSGTKIRFILDAVEGAQARAEAGELCFGTIDTWLIYKLTKGPCLRDGAVERVAHALVLHTFTRGMGRLPARRIDTFPGPCCPKCVDSSGDFGESRSGVASVRRFRLRASRGISKPALFGQGVPRKGPRQEHLRDGLLPLDEYGDPRRRAPRRVSMTTVAWRREGRLDYALEGSIFVAGSAVQWLRDGLRFFEHASESEALARSVPDSDGVYVVPAFVGLGAPYWDEQARGTIVGLTRGTSRAHITRATLESIAYQTRDVMDAMASDSGITPSVLRVDGGACENDFLMQFQADILGIAVERPAVLEATAMGAARLAGLAVGFWQDDALLSAEGGASTLFEPALSADERESRYADWRRAVERSRHWVQSGAGQGGGS